MKQPDKRLCAVAELVRQGAVFADIGTDHALLPVFLCRTGRISRAIAADIVEGPLSAARRQVAAARLEKQITLRLADGLSGMENEGLTDIAICGMGGELIVSILSRAPFIKDARVRLILQPMTHAADVRRYLAREGFAIVGERIASAAGKCYFAFAAEYTGEPYTLSRLEATFGEENLRLRKNDPVFLSLLLKEKRGQEKKCRGMKDGGLSDTEENAYLAELNSFLKENNI